MLKLNKIDKKLLNSNTTKKINNKNKEYVVIEDRGAGNVYIEKTWNGKHFPIHTNIIFEGSKRKCIKYIENYESDTTVYEVFNSIYWDDDTEQYEDNYYVEKRNCNSGSYQYKGLDFRDIEAEFNTIEEAEEYIKLKTNIA